MKKVFDENGLTLIELIVTVTIISFLLAGIYGILGGTFKLWQQGSEKIDIQQNARIALNMLETDIRRADKVYSYSGPSSLYLSVNNQQIRYHLSGTQMLKAASGQGNNPVAYNLKELQYNYYPTVSSCTLVEVYMELESQGYVYELSSKINVRASDF
ncbi:MAG: hypothetical protein APF76_07980 [Desulfitibacter sp. BRH_c19]|nr:MAG: hypothetical protein APF76_07980 [Desulfitibacter sp. BRH_c19]